MIIKSINFFEKTKQNRSTKRKSKKKVVTTGWTAPTGGAVEFRGPDRTNNDGGAAGAVGARGDGPGRNFAAAMLTYRSQWHQARADGTMREGKFRWRLMKEKKGKKGRSQKYKWQQCDTKKIK